MSRRIGHVRHARRARTHALGRTIAIALAASAGFAIVWVQTIAVQFGGAIDTRDAKPLVTRTPDSPVEELAGDPLTILLIGSDVRSDENGEIVTDGVEGMRSDATVVAHLSGDRSRVELVSIPRDLQVEIPDCTLFDGTVVPGGYGDFNVAFSNGGRHDDPAEAAACTINAVHDITDIPIDHWAVIDFAGFTRMVDALDGIPMCIPERIVSKRADLELDAGAQVLDGAEALGYARLRTAEEGDVSGSDLQRITRQQQLLERTLQTAREKSLFTDVGALTSFIRAGAESLTTDEQLGDLDFMVRLAYGLRGVTADALTVTTVPWEYTDDRLNVLMTDDASRMFDDIRHDRPLSVMSEGDATSEWGADPSAGPDAAGDSPEPDSPNSAAPDSIDEIRDACGS
ncbi:LCP family protein [Demequina aestuarii]|uniref:LCP family protein n=1 Tax=Demequina aestuarii TaxID=327095 RepID=UPI000785A701|nr:LCP family protein [Demequina aestuarii]